MKRSYLSGVITALAVLPLLAGWWQAQAQERAPAHHQQIIKGHLTGMKFPADWKISARARNLTFTNPYNQSLAARWVNGEIVYRIATGPISIDPRTTKVAKEFIPVYTAPAPGEAPPRAEHVPGQLSIYDSQPGDPNYSPIWQHYYVVVPRDYKPNTFRSAADVLRSGYQVVPGNQFDN